MSGGGASGLKISCWHQYQFSIGLHFFQHTKQILASRMLPTLQINWNEILLKLKVSATKHAGLPLFDQLIFKNNFTKLQLKILVNFFVKIIFRKSVLETSSVSKQARYWYHRICHRLGIVLSSLSSIPTKFCNNGCWTAWENRLMEAVAYEATLRRTCATDYSDRTLA